ncbi:MAG: calcium-binding protein [Solirubrobacterales bacterium]
MSLRAKVVLAGSMGIVAALLLATASGGNPTDSICGIKADYTVDDGVPYTDPPGGHTIQGSTEGDLIHAGDGADTVCAYGGSDTVYGGDGRDTLYGELGDDQLHGGRRADGLHGGPGLHDACLGGRPHARSGRDPDTADVACEKVRAAR